MLSTRLDKFGYAFLILTIGCAILIPVLALWVPKESAFAMPPYLVALLGKYVCYAILALALDLVWGYCGILSLGHGAFFALGGYAMGMYLMRQIGARGVYANPLLPDFMVFLNWHELPIPWWGFNWFAYAAAMIVFVPGILAFAFGWFAFRSRVTGVYLSIITQALTYALKLAFFRNDFGFGGNNGLTDFKDIIGFNVQSDETRATLFSLSALTLALSYIAGKAIVSSKYGKAVIAVRDAESRVRFLGYRVENYKLFVFVVSAVIAGIAGALYVPQVGIINPSEFDPANSIEAVIWVAVGGRGTLVGAAFGGLVVNFAKTYFTGSFPEYWLFGLGGLFVVVTLFMPKGLLGVLMRVQDTAPGRAVIMGAFAVSAVLTLAGVYAAVQGYVTYLYLLPYAISALIAFAIMFFTIPPSPRSPGRTAGGPGLDDGASLKPTSGAKR
jgi:urea transport system permease protein